MTVSHLTTPASNLFQLFLDRYEDDVVLDSLTMSKTEQVAAILSHVAGEPAGANLRLSFTEMIAAILSEETGEPAGANLRMSLAEMLAGIVDAPSFTPESLFASVDPLGDWVDDAATNLIPYSQAFTNSWWTDNGLTPEAALAPDGTMTAIKYTPTSGSNSRNLDRTTANGFTISGLRIYSIHAKAENIPYLYANLAIAAADAVEVVWDLDTGLVSSDPGPQIVSAGSYEVANGFRRYWAAYNGAGDNLGFRWAPSHRNASNNQHFDGATQTITFWQADCIAGLAVPTSPIVTSGSTESRTAVTKVLEGAGETLNATAGTFIVEHTAVDGEPLLSWDEGAAFMSAAGHRTMLTYDEAGTVLYDAGGFIATGEPITIGDDLYLGMDSGGRMNARLKSVKYLDWALSEDEAQQYFSHPKFTGSLLSLINGGQS